MHCTVHIQYWAVLYWLLATLYRMRTMKESLLTEFESFCDVEKFKLYILCGETRNYIRDNNLPSYICIKSSKPYTNIIK